MKRFIKGLDGIKTDNAEISQLMGEIKDALRSKDEAVPKLALAADAPQAARR